MGKENAPHAKFAGVSGAEHNGFIVHNLAQVHRAGGDVADEPFEFGEVFLYGGGDVDPAGLCMVER